MTFGNLTLSDNVFFGKAGNLMTTIVFRWNISIRLFRKDFNDENRNFQQHFRRTGNRSVMDF